MSARAFGWKNLKPARTVAPIVGPGRIGTWTLDAIAEICERAARGDLEARVVGIDETSELAPISHAINHMLDMADCFVREASAAMSSCSAGSFHRPILERGLKGAYRQSASIINGAAVSMRSDHDAVAFAGQLAIENAEAVTKVAAACEELHASGANISSEAAQAVQLTHDAVAQAATAVEAARSLHEVGRTIGNIVALISKVAGQTNLLALNATIEAARAGENGSGFAVVAREVKELSRNTTSASDEIARELNRMVSSITRVADMIDDVKNSISHTYDRADAIDTATKNQALATAEISRAIVEVSHNTSRVSDRIGARRAQT